MSDLRRIAMRAAGISCVCSIGFLPAATAQAQQVNSGIGVGPSAQVTRPAQFSDPAPVIPTAEHLLGDWGGVRTSLLNHGVGVIFDNINEFAGNVTGGAKQNSTNAGQTGLDVGVDWNKLAGLRGFATHTVIVGRYGASTSNGFGDTLSPVQEIYGAGGNVVAKLVYFYGEQRLFGNHLDIAAGRFPVGTDFAASPLNCNFMNNILCGNPKELVGAVGGFSAWPSSSWGIRARYRPIQQFYIQVGLFEASKAVYSNLAGYRSNWTINTSRDSGAEFPAEMEWEPTFGRGKLPGHYKVGMAWDTSPYAVWGEDIHGGAVDLTHQPQKYERGHGQYWLMIDQMLVRNGPGAHDGLTTLAGCVHNDPSTYARADQVYVGLLDQDFWKARPKDIVGLLYTHQTMNGRLSGEQSLDIDYGLTIANSASGVQRHQDLLELNYDIHIMNGVTFEPDFQYIFRPNAQANLADAAVLGFRSHISF